MEVSVRRAAVLGSGVMGSTLAAHLANAGIPTLLLDIVPPAGTGIDGDPSAAEYRNAFAAGGLARALKSKPAAFYTPAGARMITVGNLDDDLESLRDVDWVLEAVVERLDIKQSLFEKILPFLSDRAIVTTNTSGLSVTDMAGVLPDARRPRFLGTHFFNPPRYLRLLELIPHDGTDPEVLAAVTQIGEERLGKGVVIGKDTPSFIANRVGGFWMMALLRAALDGGFTVEEVDALTGPVIGRPKSATFRTADLVGVDVLAHAAKTVYDRATEDERRDYFQPPPLLMQMIDQGMLGEKSGRGFYQKSKRDGKTEILTLDFESLEYRERRKASFPTLEMIRPLENVEDRIRGLLQGKDRGAELMGKVIAETLVYAANRLGEIAEDVVSIDRAMRWGFGWDRGPFELWDTVGVEASVARMEKDGFEIPQVVHDVLATEAKTFYHTDDTQRRTYFHAGERKPVPASEKSIDLTALKVGGKTIKKNTGASLIDVGDGIACLEFHSKMNAIGADIIGMIHGAVKEVEANWDGLVIGNRGENFSVGANIMLLLLEAQDGNWEEIDLMVRSFQKATMAMKYCAKPVVAAPFGITVGGGCEVFLGANHVVASAETYAGLVEIGVGLIPAGGGCKEMLLRNLEGAPAIDGVDLFPYTRGAFEAIGMARVSTSAVEAREFKLLRSGDGIVMNPDHLLYSAKAMALGLSRQGYRAPDPTIEVPVVGESGIGAIGAQLYNMHEGGFISEYDRYLGAELARVLCGGNVPDGTMVTEQYLLNLEREVFLRLCGQKKTHERMKHMLKKGKPLRN